MQVPIMSLLEKALGADTLDHFETLLSSSVIPYNYVLQTLLKKDNRAWPLLYKQAQKRTLQYKAALFSATAVIGDIPKMKSACALLPRADTLLEKHGGCALINVVRSISSIVNGTPESQGHRMLKMESIKWLLTQEHPGLNV